MSPAREERLNKIELALKKNKAQFQKFEVKSGSSMIGSKDYQGRIRNIFIEQRRKLET